MCKNKRFYVISVFILLLIISLSGCYKESEGILSETLQSEQEKNEYISSNTPDSAPSTDANDDHSVNETESFAEADDEHSVNKTESFAFDSIPIKLLLDDYDYMVEVMLKSAPYSLAMAERKYGIDKDEIFTKFRLIIESYSMDTMSLAYFYTILNNLTVAFHNISHFRVVDIYDYTYMHNLYLSSLDSQIKDPLGDYNFTKYVDELTISAYQYLKIFYTPSGHRVDEYFANTNVANDDSFDAGLKLEFLNDETAYIRIPSFSGGEFKRSYPYLEILELYKQANDCSNLIIDLADNSGGSTPFWMYNIVTPNIDKSVEHAQYSIAPADSLVPEYLELLSNIFILADNNEILSKPNFPENMKNDNFKVYKAVTTLNNTEKLFNGDIYVLISRKCYSASESFIVFCKQSGFATLVGENTGGDGQGFTPITMFLPNTGLLFRFSATFALNPDGSSNEELGTTPDYYKEDGETFIDACLRVIEERKVLGE